LKPLIEEYNNMANTNTDAVAEDIKKLGKDVGDMARNVKADATEKTGELSKNCKAFLDSAITAAKEVPSVAAARTKEVAASTDEYVRQNPWRAVTLSAGVGLLFGVLFSRK
jgi:ElaB/YqjD/DUF883 family membrane-anchored ribosome-binding protein